MLDSVYHPRPVWEIRKFRGRRWHISDCPPELSFFPSPTHPITRYVGYKKEKVLYFNDGEESLFCCVAFSRALLVYFPAAKLLRSQWSAYANASTCVLESLLQWQKSNLLHDR